MYYLWTCFLFCELMQAIKENNIFNSKDFFKIWWRVILYTVLIFTQNKPLNVAGYYVVFYKYKKVKYIELCRKLNG